MNASPSPFSAHSDVLDAAVPEDAPGKERLLTELKNRGKAAVAAGQWPDARRLYEKGLQCCLEKDTNQKAILYSNLSLVEGKMNQWSEARHAANNAVQVDAAYTKGWWRLGQAHAALQNFDEAVKSLEEATKLEPSNKALQKELTKQKENAEKAAAEKAKQAEQEAKQSEKANDPPPPVASTKSKPAAQKKSEDAKESMQVDDEDDTTFTKSEVTRGYKIVNGKKTSYFHNELSEEAKQLIGDIAPKKIETASPSAPTSGAGENKGASAWNKAGTWEERDVTQWAKDSLKAQLESTTYTLPASSPAPSADVTTKKAKVDGHASFAVVRGKKRYIYEMSAEIEWSFTHNGNDANGKIIFPDIDGTCMVGEPYDATGFHIEHSDEAQLRPVLEGFVHKQGYRDVLHESIDRWVGLFKETY